MVSFGIVIAVGLLIAFIAFGGQEKLRPAFQTAKQDLANLRRSFTQRTEATEMKSQGVPEGG